MGASAPIDPALLADPSKPSAETIRTAKSGELLFEQSVSNAAVLELLNTVVPTEDISMNVSKRTVEITEGMKFYTALNIGSETSMVACSFERPVKSVARLNPSAVGHEKLCFTLVTLEDKVDPDDIKRDPETLTSSTFYVASGPIGANLGPPGPYQKLYRWEPNLFTYQTTEPARFKKLDADAERGETGPDVAVRFTATPDGGELQRVYITGSQVKATAGEPVLIKPDMTFPAVSKVGGAEIELLALNDGVLAYRILSGFDDQAVYFIDLPE